eukprot:3510810-Rhodomonas_salina.1
MSAFRVRIAHPRGSKTRKAVCVTRKRCTWCARRLGLAVVQLWNISDRVHPRLHTTHQIEGNFRTARMLDGTAYIIAQGWPRWQVDSPALSL